MKVLVDTHALLWYFTDDKKLSQSAEASLEQAVEIFIPTIVLMELLYLLQKQNRKNYFTKILKLIQKQIRYSIVSLDLIIVEKSFKFSEDLEIHDNTIAISAQILQVPVITKDLAIKRIYKNIIW